jgi:hypothetical protein
MPSPTSKRRLSNYLLYTYQPKCISVDIFEREKAIFVEQAKESGKPDTISLNDY